MKILQKSLCYLFIVFFIMLFSSGFQTVFAGGENIALYLQPDSSAKASLQMAERMESKLHKLLIKKGKYNVRIIKSREEFNEGQNEYLLAVKFIRYNPGSKAARLIVGFGAGSASLDIHYKLIGPGGKILLSKKDGCGTSLDWQRIAKKLNQNIFDNIVPVISRGDSGEAYEDSEYSDEEEPVRPKKKKIRSSGKKRKPLRDEDSEGYAEDDESSVSSFSGEETERERPEKSHSDLKETSSKKDPSDKLKKLKELYDEGLITDAEYEKKRLEIIEEL